MEKKREGIINQLIANIERAIAIESDIETAIVDFRQFIAALESEADYHSKQFILENSIKDSKSEKQKQDTL